MHVCDQQTRFDLGRSVKSIIGLRELLVPVERDPMRWREWYRCRDCEAIWLEAYEPTGRGEAPRVYRVSSVGSAEPLASR